MGNASLASAGSDRSDLLRRHDIGPPPELVYDNESARMVTWRNVVIQSVHVADLAYVHALGAVLRRQLRASSGTVVSLALLRTGMKPAKKDVRNEMTRLLKQTEGRVLHVLVIEDVGLLAQMLITVCRGVLMIAGKGVTYSIHSARSAGILAALPKIEGQEREAILANALSKAITLCSEAP